MQRLPILAALTASLAFIAPASQAEVIRYQATLSPEVSGATGSGSATLDYDSLAHTLRVSAIWSGLSGLTTVAHIHCCTLVPQAGLIAVAVTPSTLPGFPAGTVAGSYTSALLDLTASSSYTAGFVNNFAGGVLGNAESALLAGLDAQRAYFNVHTSTFPAGEIRGFLERVTDVPEPGTLALAAVGLVALARRRVRAMGAVPALAGSV